MSRTELPSCVHKQRVETLHVETLRAQAPNEKKRVAPHLVDDVGFGTVLHQFTRTGDV